MKEKHYGNIDGLRTFACIGVLMMHVLSSNSYITPGYLFDNIIPRFGRLVYLFMIISAFGMCCGYLERMLNNQVSIEKFYARRYLKILPFFAVLVLVDIIASPSKEALIEGFADITLMYGLFQNSISVIGVGWFLGLIFAFYLIFPFYCVLVKNKKRAWIAFAVSILFNYFCGSYFDLGEKNIVFCLCYFIAGGLIYLYRETLGKFSTRFWWLILVGIVGSGVAFFESDKNTIINLVFFGLLFIFSLKEKDILLQNKFTKFFGSISMEVYISHMFMLKVIEKLGLNVLIGNGYLQYLFTIILTISSTIIFAVIIKKIIDSIFKMISAKSVKN